MAKTNKKQPKAPAGDRTTWKRYAQVFNEETDLRKGYYDNCDRSLQVTPKLKQQIEQQVQDWLDNHGIESHQLQISVRDTAGVLHLNWLQFERSEVAMKTCSNNWQIIHIAEGGFWPRLLSSKPKLTIQHSGGDYLRMENEIRSINYSDRENALAEHAEYLLDPVLFKKRKAKAEQARRSALQEVKQDAHAVRQQKSALRRTVKRVKARMRQERLGAVK